MAMYRTNGLLGFMEITKALADENRVRILLMLRGGELCVCEIVRMLGLAQSTVSKHLAILRAARLVTARKAGTWIFYRLSDPASDETIGGLLSWLEQALGREPAILADQRELKEITQGTNGACDSSQDEPLSAPRCFE